MRNMVDLPAPLGPSSAVTPGPIRKLASDTATSWPNHFEAPVTSMGQSIGAGLASTLTGSTVIGSPGCGGTGTTRTRPGRR